VKYHKFFDACCLLATIVIGLTNAVAADKGRKDATPEALTPAGEQLQAQYAGMLTALQAEISKALPQLDEHKKTALEQAQKAEQAAEANRKAKQQAVDKAKGLPGTLSKMQAAIEKATAAVAAAEEKLKQAEAASSAADEKAKAVKLAKDALTKSQAARDKAVSELKKTQELAEQAKAQEPQLLQELEAAKETLAQAQKRAQAAAAALLADANSFLASDKFDAKLVKCAVLVAATPRDLAEFAQQSQAQQALVEKLLADDKLLKEMLLADGAKDGQYGPAMKIYTDIQRASAKLAPGVLQRLALAISLEHAVPIEQSNPLDQTEAPATVDPVKRYLHYEKAFLDGELDSGFKDLTVWEYRNATNGNEPDWTLAWGRQMLWNYRPDLIANPDYRWRYVESVKTEVKYGSQDVKYDLPKLQSYQNIIMNGGVCGRRAFFGRFILRCFGIPTLPRPQPGHATLVHWTPKGWVICLGATWGFGSVQGAPDTEFLAMTQARSAGTAYVEVQRAEWVLTALGQTKAAGAKAAPSLWKEVALARQRQLIEQVQAQAIAAVGTDIGEANESKEKDVVAAVAVPEADRKIVVGAGGSITIPAVATSKPTSSTAKIRFMKGQGGGMQLHYSRLGPPEEFEYTFDAPAAGKYTLSARVVTTSAEQHLLVAANDAQEPTDIALPFTVGMWDQTAPVEVVLVKGQNVLRFSRSEQAKGLTIKDFTLTPVK